MLGLFGIGYGLICYLSKRNKHIPRQKGSRISFLMAAAMFVDSTLRMWKYEYFGHCL